MWLVSSINFHVSKRQSFWGHLIWHLVWLSQWIVAVIIQQLIHCLSLSLRSSPLPLQLGALSLFTEVQHWKLVRNDRHTLPVSSAVRRRTSLIWHLVCHHQRRWGVYLCHLRCLLWKDTFSSNLRWPNP